jgi:hypothetical protein
VAPDETALWGMANGIYATGVDPVSPPHELQDVSSCPGGVSEHQSRRQRLPCGE